MYVNIRRSVECVNFEDVEAGQLFVYNDKACVRLKDNDIYDAVELETGELMCFDSTDPVIIPDVVELTVEL